MHYIFYQYAISLLNLAGEANDVGADTENAISAFGTYVRYASYARYASYGRFAYYCVYRYAYGHFAYAWFACHH